MLTEGLQQINGWTEPSVQDLRKMIVQHGGIFHAYLDKKSLVYVQWCTRLYVCMSSPVNISARTS